MATLINLAKILLPALSVAGVGVGSAFAFMPTHQASTKPSVVLVKQQTAPNSQPDQPYQCRLKGAPSKHSLTTCNLVELSISNNWIDLAGIKQATKSTTPSLDDLKDATKQFKLEVSEELFNKVSPKPSNIVEIVSDANSQAVHAEVSTLFKVDGATVDYNNVSTLLGRATSESDSINTSKIKKCSLTSSAWWYSKRTCTFKPFGDTTATDVGPGYSKITDVTIDAADSTSLTADQYYFVNYYAPLAKSDLASLSKVYANKAILDNVVPVIFNGSGDHKKAFILSETPTFKGVVVKKDSVTSTKSLTFNGTSRTYKCKYGSYAAADCELRLIPFADDKTSHNTTDIKGITTAGPVAIANTTSPNLYYKVEVPSDFFTRFKAITAQKSIQILDETNGSKRLFTLDSLYHIDDRAEYKGQPSYIVKSATPATPTVNFTDADQKYCLFAAADPTDFTNAQECEIKDLGTTITPNQSFQTPTDATSILTTNTYLVTFVDASHVTPPTAKDSQDQPLLFLQVASGEDQASKTKVASFAQANIDYVLIVDGDKANKFAFVLDKTSPST